MADIPNIPGEMAKKIPPYQEFKKNPGKVIQYTGLILFIAYLSFNEYFRRDDCRESIAVIQQTLETEREMHKNTYSMLTERIKALEEGYLVKSRALNDVENKVGVEANPPIVNPQMEGGAK